MPLSVGKDETQTEWMHRCVPEMMGQGGGTKRPQEQAVAACLTMWRDAKGEPAPAKDIDEIIARWCALLNPDATIHKTHVSEGNGFEYVLSDASVDRLGDTIAVDGWDLRDFNRNPICLFNHNPDFIVGKWDDLRADSVALRGRLRIAKQGTSRRI